MQEDSRTAVKPFSVVMPAGHGLDLACVNTDRAGGGVCNRRHLTLGNAEVGVGRIHRAIISSINTAAIDLIVFFISLSIPASPSPLPIVLPIFHCVTTKTSRGHVVIDKKKNNIAKKRAVVSEGRAHIQLATYLIVIILETPN